MDGKAFLKFLSLCIEDKNLPKYKRMAAKVDQQEPTSFLIGNSDSSSIIVENSSPTVGKERDPLILTFFRLLFSLLNINTKAISPDPMDSIIMMIKDAKELSELKQDEEELNRTIERYKLAGQVAYAEGLEDHKASLLMEQSLLRSGINRYIEVSELRDFFNKHSNFSASWLKNFAKPLPDEAINKKLEADSLEVFDNYFLIHPDILEVSKETKEEDPILLGYVKNSKRAFYIHSWIYEDWGDLDIDLEKLMNEGVRVSEIEHLRK